MQNEYQAEMTTVLSQNNGKEGFASTGGKPEASETPLRVLFLDHTASLGGGEIAMLEMARHLDPVCCYPIVTLFSDGALKEKLIGAGIETYVLPLSREIVQTRKDSLGSASLLRIKALFGAAGFTLRLTRFIRTMEVDIVYTNSLKADVLGGIAARRARVPVIWHIRDRIETDYLPALVVNIFRRLCRSLPNYVLANSHATLETLQLGRKDRQAVVYSGVDLEPYDVQPTSGEDCQAEPGIERAEVSQTKCIGLIGRISPWKGQHIFVQAAAQVRARFPDVRFQIIGAALFAETDYEAQVRALVSSLQLDDSIQFLGFREDIPALLAQIDILVHASTSGEPFGQVIVQGMSAGKPVVATQGGGVLEIVVDGVTGLLVPGGDAPAMAEAISALLEHPGRAAELGRNGHQLVRERFTIQIAARKAEEVLREVAGRSKSL